MPQHAPDEVDAPPKTELPATPDLASRGDRLLAIIVDAFVMLAVAIPVGIYSGYFSAAFEGNAPPSGVSAEIFFVAWGWFFLVNGYLLARSGQTVGKRLLDIRICDFGTGSVPPFWRLLVRVGIYAGPGLLGGPLGGLLSWVDNLFIFRKDRRCIHDLLAGTHVVKT